MSAPRVTWTPEMDAALIDMRRKGIGYRVCGDKIGVGDKTAGLRVVALGLPTWPPRTQSRVAAA